MVGRWPWGGRACVGDTVRLANATARGDVGVSPGELETSRIFAAKGGTRVCSTLEPRQSGKRALKV